MPSDAEHRAAFERHQRAFDDTIEDHADWAAVMLFYCAVHQVELLLSQENRHSCEHAEREYEIKTRYMTMWPDYRALKGESLKTRYLQGGMFSMPAKQVKSKLRDERLANIIKDVDARIKARTLIPPVIQ